jgi:hypothetical protein
MSCEGLQPNLAPLVRDPHMYVIIQQVPGYYPSLQSFHGQVLNPGTQREGAHPLFDCILVYAL